LRRIGEALWVADLRKAQLYEVRLNGIATAESGELAWDRLTVAR
jgi:hypothetical protein